MASFSEDFSPTDDNHAYIFGLPGELMAFVFEDLSIGDLGRLAQTCTLFKDLTTPIMYSRDNKKLHPRAMLWAASVDPAKVQIEDVMTVLELAIRYGGQMHLSYGGPDSYYTPLHLAAARGNLPVVKKLLDYGANPNALGKDYLYNISLSLDHEKFDKRMEKMNQAIAVSSRFSLWRPLFVPFVLKHDGIIRALMRKGASPILAVVDPIRVGSAPETGNINILHILASQKDREYTDATGRSYFKRCSNLINVPVPRGAAPLSMAMRHSNFDLIRDIIANGGDIEAVSEVGTTPLIEAIKCFNKGKTLDIRNEYMKLIHYLIKNCNAKVGKHPDDRVLHTPLACAAKGFNNDFQCIKDILSIIDLLLDKGADVNEKPEWGISLLGVLCWVISQRKKQRKEIKKEDGSSRIGLLEVFKELVIKRKADVNVLLPSGMSLLGACILKFGREPLAFFQTLLELKAKLAPNDINPVFREWVTDIRLRNTTPAFNMLDYKQDITQDSIDFAYSACLNGEEKSWEKIWDMLQSHFPDSTVPQKIAAEALIQDVNLKRFNKALEYNKFDGSYIHTDGNSFLHLIIKRLQNNLKYKASQAVGDAREVLLLKASIEATDENGETALDKLMYMRKKGVTDYDPLRLFLHDIEHGKRSLLKAYEDRSISEGVYEERYQELIEL
ncbi:ankyrin repeat-containing domain protein [Trichoderma sp. SZMC 28014]